MSDSTWQNYFEKTKSKPPRPLLVKALPFVKERRKALDLGSGALNDTVFLLKQGFEHVTAVDREPVAKEIAAALPADRFEYVIATFETFPFPTKTFDLVNAQYALPFIAPEKFAEVFANITNSLVEGGVFTGQLFGDRDGWSAKPGMTFHTLAQAKELLSGLEILSFEEEENDQPTAAGVMKHWHVFHFVGRK